MAEQRQLIFLHIHKTGGTTLRDVLTRHYAARQTFHLHSHFSAEPFTKLSQQQRDNTKLLHGHMQFGLHPFFSVPPKYVTVLRNPADRVLSEYAYNMSNPGFKLREKVIRLGIKGPVEMVESGEFRLSNNGQVRLIGGCFDKPFGTIDENDYQQAVANLEQHFDFYATLRFFDEMILLMSEAYGWKPPYYLRLNKTKGEKPKISETDKEKILVHNQWDQRLCEYADDRMRKLVETKGAAFAETLAAFREQNKNRQGRLKARVFLQNILFRRA